MIPPRHGVGQMLFVGLSRDYKYVRGQSWLRRVRTSCSQCVHELVHKAFLEPCAAEVKVLAAP
jgi:hypothetical protein